MRDDSRANKVRRIEEEIRRLTRRLVELAVADDSEGAEGWVGRRCDNIEANYCFENN